MALELSCNSQKPVHRKPAIDIAYQNKFERIKRFAMPSYRNYSRWNFAARFIKMRPDLLAVPGGSLHSMPLLSSLRNSATPQTSSFEFLKSSIPLRRRHTGN